MDCMASGGLPPEKAWPLGPEDLPVKGPLREPLPESVSPPSELIQHQPFLQVQLALPLHCEVWPQPVRGLPCKAGGSGGTLFTVLSSASSQSGSALLVGLWDHPSTLPRSGCWASVKPVGTRTLGVGVIKGPGRFQNPPPKKRVFEPSNSLDSCSGSTLNPLNPLNPLNSLNPLNPLNFTALPSQQSRVCTLFKPRASEPWLDRCSSSTSPQSRP